MREESIEIETNDHHHSANDRNEDAIDKLHKQLNDIGEGCQLRIRRVEPAWCDGVLETLSFVDPSSPIDIDSIIKRWGGQKLRLQLLDSRGQHRGGVTISCRSYRPRVKGHEITESDLTVDNLLPQRLAQQAPVPAQPPVNPLASLGLDIPALIKLAQSSGKGGGMDSKALELIFSMQAQALSAAQQAPQQNIMGQMAQMMEMFKMFGEMRSMFGGDAASGGGEGADPMMPMLGQLLGGIMQQKQAQQLPQQRPQQRPFVVPPGQVSAQRVPPLQPPAQIGPPVAQSQDPVSKDVNTDAEPNLNRLADALSSLSPEDASFVALNAFGAMPEEKRQRTMQNFMGEMFDDYVDEGDDLSDTLTHEQGNQPQVPNAHSGTPCAGWPVRTNEGNDPLDR